MFSSSLGRVKLNKDETVIILKTLRSYSRMGTSLSETIDNLIELERDEKIKKVYMRVKYLKKKKSLKISAALKEVGVLNGYEEFLLEVGIDTKKSLDSILKNRQLSSNYEKKLFGAFVAPFIIFVVLFMSIPPLKSLIHYFDTSVAEMMKRKMNFDITGQLDHPFWMNIPFVEYISYGIVIVMFGSVARYAYLSFFNPNKLYKFFKGKAYSELGLFLNVVKTLLDTGKDPKLVFTILLDSNQFPHQERMLKQLIKNKQLAPVFEFHNYPKSVVHFIKIAETSKDLRGNIGPLADTCEEQAEIAIDQIYLYYKNPVFWASVLSVIIFIIPTLFILIDMILLGVSALRMNF
jgi:type II secretory pathway component PulF